MEDGANIRREGVPGPVWVCGRGQSGDVGAGISFICAGDMLFGGLELGREICYFDLSRFLSMAVSLLIFTQRLAKIASHPAMSQFLPREGVVRLSSEKRSQRYSPIKRTSRRSFMSSLRFYVYR